MSRPRWMRGALPRAACALVLGIACVRLPAQEPVQARTGHPRLLVNAGGREALGRRLGADSEMRALYESIRTRVQPYVDRHRTDPAWIVSRLQMYWQTHSTRVYIRNGIYDHADGSAPAPTVRFNGTRDANTQYATPNLEDVKPYMGEGDRLWLQNKAEPGRPWEWAPQARTGRIAEAINERIGALARDAAFLYWYTRDESYAKFAYDIFDTYMTGIYYREAPIDAATGQPDTLGGLQTFEVIQDDGLAIMAETYDFLHDYAARRAGARRALHEDAFRKWADVIIANGVPWNNWNLIEASYLLHVAAVLDPDASYADKRGAGYYLRAVLDGNGPRQWSLQRLLDFGYDPQTGIWNESPAYSINVGNDFMQCLDILDEVFGIDLLPRMPVLPRVARALPQYLLPNGKTVGFGDTRYEVVRTAMIERLVAHAQRHGHADMAAQWSALLAAVRGAGDRALSGMDGFHTLFALLQSAPVPAPTGPTSVTAYQTPTLFAPNVSWLIQRSGFLEPGADDHAMVISEVGSSGNHAHANGIAMELYAQGLSLAPEGGKGSGYERKDHAEYYAQFPVHDHRVVRGELGIVFRVILALVA